MEQRRDPLETKEIGLKRLVSCYEKNNRKRCSAAKRRELEQMYMKDILPQVYKGK